MTTGSTPPESQTADAVRRVYTLCFLFLMEVIEKIGTDRALDLLYKAVDRQAEITEKELSSYIKREAGPLERGLEVYSHFMGDLGAKVTTKPQGNSGFSINVARCPIYEAYLSIGLECDVWMRGLCTNMVLPSLQKMMHRFQSDSELSLVKYRLSADEPCLLRLELKDPHRP